MKRTLIFLQFKIVNQYTNIKFNSFLQNVAFLTWDPELDPNSNFFGNGSGSGSFLRKPREMENISRGSTFGDHVTIRTEASMQDVTVARLQSDVMYCVGVSLWTVKIFLAQH
jgi:hypothetical protein